MKYIKFLFIVSISLIFTNCNSKKGLSGIYTHEVECMGSELDGTITLKTWGKGKNGIDAIEQARKEVINTILFLGIRNGQKDCDTRPILNAQNIRENKTEYFNNFFKDGGDYKKFVSNKDESFGKKVKVKGRDGEVMFGFIIRVMKNDLKNQMLKDGILIAKESEK